MTRYTGRIVRWEDARGFGFVLPDDGGRQIFVHVRDIAGRCSPRVGDAIRFSSGQDKRGRPCAVRAVLCGGASYGGAALGTTALVWYNLALLFLVAVAVAALMRQLHGGVLVAYLALSLVTFCSYAIDKRAARTGGWRVAESTLHMWALLGGWPGAVVAQQQLRHKSRKREFREIFYLTVGLNCGLLVWLACFGGMVFLQGWWRSLIH